MNGFLPSETDDRNAVGRTCSRSNAMCLQIVEILAYSGLVSEEEGVDFASHCGWLGVHDDYCNDVV